MSEKPRRRWFQFRLSTWLVLVAIAAWAMACWPWLAPRNEAEVIISRQFTLLIPGGTVLSWVDPFAGVQVNPSLRWPPSLCWSSSPGRPGGGWLSEDVSDGAN